jgi:hypothetical protein
MVECRDNPSMNGCSELVQSPSRVLLGPKPEPSYSNNVVGGSSRKRITAANGVPPAKRLKVAVDVDEGNNQRPMHNQQK